LDLEKAKYSTIDEKAIGALAPARRNRFWIGSELKREARAQLFFSFPSPIISNSLIVNQSPHVW
jgi:hypothetical protein